jgi:hypothetical protein
MRGKAKHALFDYEAEAYEQLHHVLREKWEQILDQARGQLRYTSNGDISCGWLLLMPYLQSITEL